MHGILLWKEAGNPEITQACMGRVNTCTDKQPKILYKFQRIAVVFSFQNPKYLWGFYVEGTYRMSLFLWATLYGQPHFMASQPVTGRYSQWFYSCKGRLLNKGSISANIAGHSFRVRLGLLLECNEITIRSTWVSLLEVQSLQRVHVQGFFLKWKQLCS